jgi:hypothetical protein
MNGTNNNQTSTSKRIEKFRREKNLEEEEKEKKYMINSSLFLCSEKEGKANLNSKNNSVYCFD